MNSIYFSETLDLLAVSNLSLDIEVMVVSHKCGATFVSLAAISKSNLKLSSGF